MKYFKLKLLLKHPNINPDILTEQLDIKPFNCKKGHGSRYSSWQYIREFSQNEDLAEELGIFLDLFYMHKDFLCDFIKDGGYGSLIISFPGDVYHGVDINNDLLCKITDMGLKLGIEVFPDWKMKKNEKHEKLGLQ